MFNKVKMDLSFPAFPIIYMWIQNAFDKCETMQDYKDFVLNCINEAKETKNQVKQEAYLTTAHVVFSKISGKSLESIIE